MIRRHIAVRDKHNSDLWRFCQRYKRINLSFIKKDRDELNNTLTVYECTVEEEIAFSLLGLYVPAVIYQ